MEKVQNVGTKSAFTPIKKLRLVETCGAKLDSN